MRRIQWGIFNRWLKLVERESLDCSAGLIDELVSRRKQYERFSFYLIDLKFGKVVCINSHRLANALLTTEGEYLYLGEYTSDKILSDNWFFSIFSFSLLM